MHKSIGAIIKKNDKILLIDRAHFPYGWAGPAGHADDNETPKQAIIREVKEETNLDIKKYKLLIHEYVDWNECVQGVKGHDWYVYEVGEWRGKIKRNKKEVKEIGWFNQRQIKNLNLEKIWNYWFKKLKII
jgi:ADP-ribose pyrophosphatase YjhB (NUDIX family)